MAVSLDFETTLQEVARDAVPVVADWCSITLVQPGAARRPWPRRTSASASPAAARGPRGGVAEVVRTGEMELINDITDAMLVEAADDEQHLAELSELGMRAALIMPLRTPERTSARSRSVSPSRGGSFGEDDIALATSLAGRAPRCTSRNAQLYRSAPTSPTRCRRACCRAAAEIPGLEVAARYRAAGDENDVGGDFYDVFGPATAPGRR